MRKVLAFRSLVGSSLASLVILLLLAAGVYAQAGLSTVQGTVTDQQRNVVAGATVNLTNSDKNFNRTQSTNQEGSYVFAAIPPGTYKLEVEAPGFQKDSGGGS